MSIDKILASASFNNELDRVSMIYREDNERLRVRIAKLEEEIEQKNKEILVLTNKVWSKDVQIAQLEKMLALNDMRDNSRVDELARTRAELDSCRAELDKKNKELSEKTVLRDSLKTNLLVCSAPTTDNPVVAPRIPQNAQNAASTVQTAQPITVQTAQPKSTSNKSFVPTPYKKNVLLADSSRMHMHGNLRYFTHSSFNNYVWISGNLYNMDEVIRSNWCPDDIFQTGSAILTNEGIVFIDSAIYDPSTRYNRTFNCSTRTFSTRSQLVEGVQL